ncbi:uncharacterized protein LOC133744683 [Rosa rugosa]|uniref:uncharacterized protein LOC133744683 n=1 Tax=Rosa rugosa TaxID=74645 RepID=UPI002B4135A6|nr:uncharacterized protein LOC133744683 [Rosa rugosa]
MRQVEMILRMMHARCFIVRQLQVREFDQAEIAENVIWLATAAGIVCFGDSKSNLMLPFYIGMVAVVLNIIILPLYKYVSMECQVNSYSTCGNCVITLFKFQFRLFMVGMVIFQYIIIGICRKQHDALRTDNASSDSEKQY